ncbi:MAG: LysM peptidoglycan-binding domain-containing protein [Clostridia bacterium]|nr:MAG: LysM peptidoglycan-binding domain-containing protein [Clostridia bacterium]
MRSFVVAMAVLVGFLVLATQAWAGFTYTVRPGDTLYEIGQRYDVSVASLQQSNGLWGTNIRPGLSLWVPTRQPTYTVQPGDTLYSISRKWGVGLAQLQQVNGIYGSSIRPGQVLVIPTTSRPTAASRGGTVRASRDDIMLLARLVYSEARGEAYVGQVAVAAVVLNRVRDPRFPNTIAGVIFQPGAFTAVADGQFWLTPNPTAIQAAEDALAGWDPTGGALYYWNPDRSTNGWIWSRPVIAAYGRHLFAA